MANTDLRLLLEDGLAVDWKATCNGDELGDGDETFAVEPSSGECYWVCLFCRRVVRPARGERA